LLSQTVSFVGLIIVEPVMCSQDFYRDYGEERDSALSTAIMIVNARRTTWPNRDEAFSYMKLDFIWKGWGARVLRTYVVSTGHWSRTIFPGATVWLSRPKRSKRSVPNVPPHLEAVDLYRRIAPWVGNPFILFSGLEMIWCELSRTMDTSPLTF
jgi:hypothetical protein